MCMNAQSDNWEEIRTAYQVARLGTLSAAAEFLGVHHATVIRHISALEDRLGTKLFHRHARGYAPTEAGLDLMRVAAITQDQLDQLSGRIRGRGAAVSGELVVTTLASMSSQITPWLAKFQMLHPDLRVTLVADDRPLKLEYGEAHVAIRAGTKPTEPDNVVQHFMSVDIALFAHKDYVARMGVIDGPDDLARHRFLRILNASDKAPFARWISQNVPKKAVTFYASHIHGVEDALRAGMGVAPLSMCPAVIGPDLVQVMPTDPGWRSEYWLVTHVDLHRTAKVQAFLAFLKEQARQLEDCNAA
jgi:DNA-binding transcriptional LysR family regulator